MRLVHLDDVEHGCCGPAARADAEDGGAHRRLPVRDRGDERGVRAGASSATSWPSTRPGARRTRALAATARSSSGRSCAAQTSSASTWSRPVITCGTSPATTAGGASLRGADRAKDQSYMLHMLGQPQLARSMFPIGEHVEGRDAVACRTVRACRSRPSPIPRSSASRRAATPAASCDRRRVSSCTRAVRSSTPKAACSASTTARSGSRSASAGDSVSPSASPAYVRRGRRRTQPRGGRARRAVVAPGSRGRPGLVGRG